MTNSIRLALLNPNSNVETTQLMSEIAQTAAPSGVQIESKTMNRGPLFIADEKALAEAAMLIVEAGKEAQQEGVDGIIVAGFGDPGLFELREIVDIPVTGIAEAGMAKASDGGKRFSIITTTPKLQESIERTARRYGHVSSLCAVHITTGDAEFVMADPHRMSQALLKIARQSAKDDGVEAILIGGGPLASAAHLIAEKSPIPVIEPVWEGVRLGLERAWQRHRKIQ